MRGEVEAIEDAGKKDVKKDEGWKLELSPENEGKRKF